jgi:hypothetical protein
VEARRRSASLALSAKTRFAWSSDIRQSTNEPFGGFAPVSGHLLA